MSGALPALVGLTVPLKSAHRGLCPKPSPTTRERACAPRDMIA